MADLKTNTERREGEATITVRCSQTNKLLVSLYHFNTDEWDVMLHADIKAKKSHMKKALKALKTLEKFTAPCRDKIAS